MKGFALVHLPTMPSITKDDVSPEPAAALARRVEDGLAALGRLMAASGGPDGPASERVLPITRPGHDPLKWPARTFIGGVYPIERLFGVLTVTLFHIYVELDAPSNTALQEAFHYLEHYCGVEGYGGGG